MVMMGQMEADFGVESDGCLTFTDRKRSNGGSCKYLDFLMKMFLVSGQNLLKLLTTCVPSI
jgi:hypothetical protein